MPITPMAETPWKPSYTVADAPDGAAPPHPGIALVGRCLLAAIFLASGLHKLADLDGTAQMIGAQGLPAPDSLALIAGLAEVLGGAALVFGFFARLGAAGLVLFMIPTTLVFHPFWVAEEQMINFLKNAAICGGLLAIAAFGPGRFSLDARIRRARAARRLRDRW